MKCKKCGYEGLCAVPELYNKNGEFVEGYGHVPVWVSSATHYICEGCGFDQNKSLSDVLPNPLSDAGKLRLAGMKGE